MNQPANTPAPQAKSSTGRTVLISVTLTLSLVGFFYWLFAYYMFPSHLTPVELSQQETVELNQKLRAIDLPPIAAPAAESSQLPDISQRHQPAPNSDGNYASEIVDGVLTPEAYSELGARREVAFSERELNALIAHNTDLADKLALDLSDNLLSVKWLIPVDPESPMLGGKTIKLTAGVELAYRAGKPVVALKGVSLWGVPVPDAWLGNTKDIDMVATFSSSGSNRRHNFWRKFAEGIDYLEVRDGEMVVKLKR